MKKNAFKPVWFIGAIVLCLGIVMASRDMFAPKELIPWRTSFAEARAEARNANKPLLVYFTASWCGPCQRMKTTTWADKEVDAALRDFVPVKIDIDEQPDLAGSFGVESIPFFALIPPGEDKPTKSVSMYLSPEDFRKWIGR